VNTVFKWILSENESQDAVV